MALLVVLLLISPKAKADCAEQVKECEELVQSADRVIENQSDLIYNLNIQVSNLERQTKIQQEMLEERAAWYKQPQVVAPTFLILGVLAGALAK